MSIQAPVSPATFQANLLLSLQATAITQSNPGGKARAFCDLVGDQLGGLEGRTYANIGQSLLPYATFENLDFLGELFGVPRLDAVTASADVADGNFTFFVTSGTFGQINSGQNIIVPAGTQIATSSPTGPIYSLDAPVSLSASASSAGFSATCLQDGDTGNSPEGTFTSHNFRGYTNYRFGSLRVTNNFGIIAGRAAEDDDSYRYRINLEISTKRGAAQADLRLAVLQVPGVQDVVFVPQAGTFEAYIYGVAPSIPTSLLQTCQAALNDKTAYPLVGVAVNPDLIGISLSTPMTFVAGSTPSDQQNALAAAQAAGSSYINNLARGQQLVINQLADQLLQASSAILDIGQPDKPIQSIYIWRSRDDGTRYSRFLIADYIPNQGERITVEPSLTVPIHITAATS